MEGYDCHQSLMNHDQDGRKNNDTRSYIDDDDRYANGTAKYLTTRIRIVLNDSC